MWSLTTGGSNLKGVDLICASWNLVGTFSYFQVSWCIFMYNRLLHFTINSFTTVLFISPAGGMLLEIILRSCAEIASHDIRLAFRSKILVWLLKSKIFTDIGSAHYSLLANFKGLGPRFELAWLKNLQRKIIITISKSKIDVGID